MWLSDYMSSGVAAIFVLVANPILIFAIGVWVEVSLCHWYSYRIFLYNIFFILSLTWHFVNSISISMVVDVHICNSAFWLCNSVLLTGNFICLQMDSLWKYQVHHLQAASTPRSQILSHLCLFQRYYYSSANLCFWLRYFEFNMLVMLQLVLIVFRILQEFVQCAVSKYLIPSFTNKAMYNSNWMLLGNFR